MIRRKRALAGRSIPSVLLALALLSSSAVGWAGAGSRDSASQTVTPIWEIEAVHDVKRFGPMTDRSLRIDSQGRLHMVYGRDKLYYALHDGASWQIQTVDDSNSVGRYASLALDKQDHPHICYAASDVRYAHWTGDKWRIQTIDSGAYYYSYTSIEVDKLGHPHLAYRTNWGAPLNITVDFMYAHWNGDSWSIERLEEGTGTWSSIVGWPNTSLAVDSSNAPHIVYYHGQTRSLKYTRKLGEEWESETLAENSSHASLALDEEDHPHVSYYSSPGGLAYARHTGEEWQVENVGGAGVETSLALDSSGEPRISYYEGNGYVAYAYRSDGAWASETIAEPGAGGGSSSNPYGHTSLVLDASGSPHVCYYTGIGQTLSRAHAVAGAWQIETVDHAGEEARYSSLALDTLGNPSVAYVTESGGLHLARWTGEAFETQIVDPLGDAETRVAIGTGDDVHISYHALDELRYARWSSAAWEIEAIAGGREETESWRSALALSPDGRAHFALLSSKSRQLAHLFLGQSDWEREVVTELSYMSGPPAAVGFAYDAYEVPHMSAQGITYAHWTGTRWAILSPESGGETSLAVDSRGSAHLSYRTGERIRWARWTESSWLISTIRGEGRVGDHTGLDVDSLDRPHIAYYDQGEGQSALKYAQWTGSHWLEAVVEQLAFRNALVSLAVDSSDRPNIIYADADNADLKWARLAGLASYHVSLPKVSSP